eukprot:m.167557 g.167557  ORF g.167557 m.167557 type:complete len:69 (-) comp15306_c0_seq4:1548-1754(-)
MKASTALMGCTDMRGSNFRAKNLSPVDYRKQSKEHSTDLSSLGLSKCIILLLKTMGEHPHQSTTWVRQ